MTDVMRLRCSALPLAFKCAGSVRHSELRINETSEPAELGTAGHDALAELVQTGRVDWGRIPKLARRHDVNEVELRAVVAAGKQLWDEVRESFPDPRTEVALRHRHEPEPEGLAFELTGHADILGRSGNRAHVGDWKGGRLDSDYREQLLGYCALALLEDPSLDEAVAGILWVRDGEWEGYSLHRHDLEEWIERLTREIVNWDGVWRPGPHCAHCSRNHECPAAKALVRRDVEAVSDEDLVARIEDPDVLAAMAPDEMVEVLAKADLVVRYAKRVRDAIRAHVARHGDVEGSKKRLTLEVDERRSLRPLVAFPVLEAAGFDDDDMARVIEMSPAKAEKIVAKRAIRGKGAAAVRELRAQLEAADAIEVETRKKLVVRRV